MKPSITYDELYTGMRLWDFEKKTWHVVFNADTWKDLIEKHPNRYYKDMYIEDLEAPLEPGKIYESPDGCLRLLRAVNDTHLVYAIQFIQTHQWLNMPQQPRSACETLFTKGKIIGEERL